MQRIVLSLLSLAFASDALRAAATVDQFSNPNTGSSGIAISAFSPGSNGATGQSAAQVFTAGLTGLLTEADLPIWNYSNVSGSYRLQVWATSGGKPAEPPTTALATATLSTVGLTTTYPSAVSAWAAFDLSGSHFIVTAGQQYAFVLSASPNVGTYIEGGWGGIFNSNTYSGGDGYYRGANATNTPNYTTWQAGIPAFSTQMDLGFRTLVDPSVSATPEPGTLSLMAVPLLLATWRRLRR